MLTTIFVAHAPAQDDNPTPDVPSVEIPAGSAPSHQLDPAQQREFDLLLAVIRDARLERARRSDAAASLLQRDWPVAREALLGLLTVNPPAESAGQNGNGGAEQLRTQIDHARVVAAAIAELDGPPALYVDPLLNLLRFDDASLGQEVAEALARYENHNVVEKLIERATDHDLPRTTQLGAIHALAEHRQAEAIDALIALIDPDHPDSVRSAAFDALRTLTGINEFPNDAGRWRQWWDEHRDLPRDRWLARLVRSLSTSNKARRAEQQNLTERITEVYGELYIATDEADRPALMQRMLNDPLQPLRMQAIRLAERQLLNGQTLSDAVREALRQRLSDDSAEVRIAATNLLRDLDDQQAIAAAADRLLEEPNPQVQNAYLGLLGRGPTEAMVAPARLLLDRSATQAAAAEFLGRARAAEVMPEGVGSELRVQLRRLLAEEQTIEPRTVRLLAPMTTEADVSRFTRLLDHAQPEVARAAAEAFASGSLDPDPLYERLDDEVLVDRALAAAAAKGDSLAVARRLLDHRPADEDQRESWRNALAAIAERLEPTDLVALDDAARALPEAGPVRRAILDHLPERSDDHVQRNELLLRLAGVAIAQDAADLARTAQEAVNDDDLTADQQRRRAILEVDVLLVEANIAEALARAEALMEDDDDLRGSLVDRLLDAADAALDADRAEQAKTLCDAVRQWDEALDDDARARLAALEEKVNGEADPASPEVDESDSPDAEAADAGDVQLGAAAVLRV